MSAPSAGISKREFARREGCSDKLVREALKAGYLKDLPDGSLDPELVGTGWRKANRRADLGADPGAEEVRTLRTPHRASAPAPPGADPIETELEAQPHGGALKRSRRTDTEDGEGEGGDGDAEAWSQAVAERRKAVALARIRELEYDTKAGLVVPAAAVVEAVGAEYARVRTRLLAIPAEQAPRLNRLKTAAEVQDALREMIVEALEELALDGGSSTD